MNRSNIVTYFWVLGGSRAMNAMYLVRPSKVEMKEDRDAAMA
jgi:hypothetical protein